MIDNSSIRTAMSVRLICMAVFILVHLAIVSQLNLLTEDILSGDGSSDKLGISLRYPQMRIPTTPLTTQYTAECHLCADFAQIYFPAHQPAVLDNAYSTATTQDPWHRESKYPPLVHFIFRNSLCHMHYGMASLVHLIVQYLLFLGSLSYISIKLKLTKYLLPMILLTNACLFLSPVGLSWMERGQFTLFVALSYLWLMLAVITGKKRYAVCAAVFGYVKWTSFPFVFVVFLVYIVTAHSWEECKKRLLLPTVYGCTTALLFLTFYSEGLLFVKAIGVQELTFEPLGISLARILPRSFVKATPFLLVTVGLLERLSVKRDVSYLLPFFTGAAVLMLTYPTFAFDYSEPCLLAFVPCLIYWAKLPGISKTLGNVGQGLFIVFLVLAAYSVKIFFESERFVIAVYVVMAVCLIVTSFLGDMTRQTERIEINSV